MNDKITAEIKELFANDSKQVAETFRLMESGVTEVSELLEKGSAANKGVIYNHKQEINAVVKGEIPNSPIVCEYSAWIIKRLIKNNPNISEVTKKELEIRKDLLLEKASDPDSILELKNEMANKSDKLSEISTKFENAIYVYTFPTYYTSGVNGRKELRWLKIGSTKNSVWKRVVEQCRQTSMPEDPVLLRIYHKEDMDSLVTEKQFQKTLIRMLHEQSNAKNSKAGNEWFATTEDSLDCVAELLNLSIIKNFDM
jgi:hypothetical protein